jgi:hypothetical protein
MREGIDARSDLREDELRYHTAQYDEPYRSTVAAAAFPKENASLDADSTGTLLDVGTGAGVNVHWLSREFAGMTMHGIDCNSMLVSPARRSNADDPRPTFAVGDALSEPSLSWIRGIAQRHGWELCAATLFEIDRDIPKKECLGTYTVLAADGRRLQLTGCPCLPWRLLLCRPAMGLGGGQ